MRNYISVNAKHYKKDSLEKTSNHNLRISKIDYLLPKENVKYKNKNIFFDENFKIFDLDKIGKTKQGARDIVNLQFAKLQIFKEEVRKKNKSYIRKNEATLVEFVVALSREQALKYLEEGKI